MAKLLKEIFTADSDHKENALLVKVLEIYREHTNKAGNWNCCLIVEGAETFDERCFTLLLRVLQCFGQVSLERCQ